jgi:hypothetical protein
MIVHIGCKISMRQPKWVSLWFKKKPKWKTIFFFVAK